MTARIEARSRQSPLASGIIVPAALVAIAAVIRLPALLYARAIDDEAVYAVVARVMLAGGLPYRDAIERKPPLLFAVYWAIFGLFGPDNWLALHGVMLVWVLLTMLGLFWLVRRLFDTTSGVIAALLYAVLQPWATAKNLAFNGEVLMNLPLVAAYALALRPRPGGTRAFAAGLLLAIAFLLKQPAAIAAVPLGCYLLFARNRAAGVFPREAIVLGAGFALVLAATVAVLWWFGILGEAWYWTVADHTVPYVFWFHGFVHTVLFAIIALPVLLALGWRGRLRIAWRDHGAEFAAVLGWLAVSVIGASAGGRFYPHYFIQLLPPLGVLTAPVFAMAARAQPRGRWNLASFAAAWLALGSVITFAVESVQLRASAPSPAGLWLRAHSAPGDRIFVWGQQTPLYLDADRLPASRYIATFPLTGYIFGGAVPGLATRDRIVPGAWSNLFADFRAHPPRYIVDTQASPAAALPFKSPAGIARLAASDYHAMKDFPQFAQFVAQHYRRVAAPGDDVIYERAR
ncbi:MAG: glycosyltransferase family 39 protein [Sphingomonadales bacterium]|nr:glycosyltransferase family 39 protein [Sphingomonadales bacterium]